MTYQIRQATHKDIPTLYSFYQSIGQKDDGYFEAVFEKDCVVLVAEDSSPVIPPTTIVIPAKTGIQKETDSDLRRNDKNARLIAFGLLNFEPKYQMFSRLYIPEIQDLNVAPEEQQKGIATALIKAFENLARDRGARQIGLAVALTKDYGPAQRLYCKSGFMPDGYGVTYDRQPIEAHRAYPVDDDFCLMMVKGL